MTGGLCEKEEKESPKEKMKKNQLGEIKNGHKSSNKKNTGLQKKRKRGQNEAGVNQWMECR